jgi:hypothetical protein
LIYLQQKVQKAFKRSSCLLDFSVKNEFLELPFRLSFQVLHTNDEVFLYSHPTIVDYIENLINLNPNNQNLFAALPQIISALRLNKIDWEFAQWSFNYLVANPTVTIDKIINWFMTTSEGKDGENIADINSVLNSLTYQPKPLPTFASFINNFPKLPYPEYPYYYKPMPANDVYTLVGGNLQGLYISSGRDQGPYKNACAVRISLALNRLGILIPNNAITRSGSTVNGIARNYFIQARAINDFMIKTFGDTSLKLQGADANDKVKVAELLAGKNGIYVIVNDDDTVAGYTGHADLIINGYVIGGANTTPAGGVKSIRIWILN